MEIYWQGYSYKEEPMLIKTDEELMEIFEDLRNGVKEGTLTFKRIGMSFEELYEEMVEERQKNVRNT